MNCIQLQTKLREIKTLKQEFDLELEALKTNKSFEKAIEIKSSILSAIEILKRGLVVSIERAKQIMGENFFGSREIAKINLIFKENEIPKIPFTQDELMRAKELGQYLIFRIGLSGSRPLDFEAMEDLALYNNIYIYLKEDGFANAMGHIRTGWALATFEATPHETLEESYNGQTQALIKYLSEDVFKEQPVPDKFKDLWKKYSGQKEIALKFDKLLRRNALEMIYDILVIVRNKKEDGHFKTNPSTQATNYFSTNTGNETEALSVSYRLGDDDFDGQINFKLHSKAETIPNVVSAFSRYK
jgi:hypothetical protein